MKNRKLLPVFLACALVLSGCGSSQDTQDTEHTTSENETSVDADFSQTEDDMFTNRDLKADYDENDCIHIQLNGSSATCNSDAVEISGSTITITDEGTYIFSGTLDNGMIIVNAEDSDKPQLVFDGITIHSQTSAPLYILEADKVFVTLAEGSTNTLSNGGTFTTIDENNIDGTIYSKQDLTFNGNGTLSIASPAGHGIVAKDDLVFTGGTYTITSANHGLDANDSLRVKNSVFSIAAGKDGAHVENNDDAELGFIFIASGTFDIDAEGDGLSASAYVQMNDGTFDIVAGDGYENGSKQSSDNWGNFGGGMGIPGGRGGYGGDISKTPNNQMPAHSNSDLSSGTTNSDSTEETESTSMKGIKASNSILINDGSFSIDSADDSIHSNISVYINGGTFEISSGDDAFHGEEELTITSGTITIHNSYEGLEALNITVSGADISIQSTDDGINAAGGTDSSGTTGGRDAMFDGGGMAPGGNIGDGMSTNSNGSITISGGSIFMYAKGDGLDANGYIEITGGTTIVTGPTSGDTAILDYDTTATIENGSFIGVGSTMMAQTFSDGSQGTMAVQASANGGTQIRIENSDGNEIISYTPETSFQCVIISTPDLVKGDSYTIYVGEQSGTFEAQ